MLQRGGYVRVTVLASERDEIVAYLVNTAFGVVSQAHIHTGHLTPKRTSKLVFESLDMITGWDRDIQCSWMSLANDPDGGYVSRHRQFRTQQLATGAPSGPLLTRVF